MLLRCHFPAHTERMKTIIKTHIFEYAIQRGSIWKCNNLKTYKCNLGPCQRKWFTIKPCQWIKIDWNKCQSDQIRAQGGKGALWKIFGQGRTFEGFLGYSQNNIREISIHKITALCLDPPPPPQKKTTNNVTFCSPVTMRCRQCISSWTTSLK